MSDTPTVLTARMHRWPGAGRAWNVASRLPHLARGRYVKGISICAVPEFSPRR